MSPMLRFPRTIRLAAVAGLLACLAGCEADAARSLVVTGETLAKIRETPYVGGNGPGGFATARLAGLSAEDTRTGIHFTGFGPYLYELGFRPDMRITAIDGADPRRIFESRWARLRLKDASAYDAEHYLDFIEYLFLEQDSRSVTLTVEIPRSLEFATRGEYRAGTETWRLAIER